ncbi:MAG TPA: diguanylate cyclase [Burkholderiales bacterium]|nr:diguanylate cyclase [Burkholderiales bacterium]
MLRTALIHALGHAGFLRHRAALIAILVCGVALSIAAFFAISSREREVVRLTFEQKAQINAAAISLAMEMGMESVEIAGALFDPGNRITKAQYQLSGERALARNPALKAVAWTPLVPKNARRAFEAAAQKDHPGYRIQELDAQLKLVPAGERDEYLPVLYTVDRDGTGQRPFGMDRLSVVNNRGALERSRSSGEATASGRIRITNGQFQGDLGVTLVRPVYRSGVPLETADQRGQNLRGFTVSVVVVRNLIDNVLKRVGSQNIRVVLYDESAREGERFLAVWPDLAQKDPALTEKAAPGLERRVKFKVGDRDWLAVMTPEAGKPDTATSWHAWAVAGTGLLFALLLAVYVETSRRYARNIQEQAITDSLTGLHNRRFLWEWLKREFLRAERRSSTIAAIMLDIDHFKRVNDTFGHEAGDLVLKELGTLLKRSVRGTDVACRYGGEEFALVLPEISIENVRRRAEAIRVAVKQLALEYRGQSLGPIAVSLGVAVFPFHAHDGDSLFRRADEALYEAKGTGRDRVVVAASNPVAPQPPVPEQADLAAA